MPVNRDVLWASGQDESVTVNQRALIDKILARYSGEFTVFRELLQNSDDAQATKVEIHFRSKAKHILAGPLPDLNTIIVDQWIFKNNGLIFREEDWHRLKKIAEGNPDEEKIGAFGVGFYSLFSITEEPFVQSGGQWMGFYWKDNKDQLFARRGQLPTPGDDWTSFEMNLREESILPPVHDLSKFLASSITFMTSLAEVSVYLDDKRLIRLTKGAPTTPSVENIPRGMRTTSAAGIMTVKEVRRTPLRINAEVMKWIYKLSSPPKSEAPKAPAAQAVNFFGKLLSSFTAPPPPPPVVQETIKPEDLLAVKANSVDITIFSAEVNVRLDKKLTTDLQRSTKKNPPGRLKYELVYTGKSEYDASKSSEDTKSSIFDGLRANLDGSGSSRIFIGHATGQTTGIGGHMAARFIPTVERESIDLVDKSVAVWNQELLSVGGFLARFAYELELASIKALWANAKQDPVAEEQLINRALHVMLFFTFHHSTPLDKVATFMQKAFFSCGLRMPFPIITTRGVRNITEARLPDPALATFLTDLPVIPADVMYKSSRMIESLKHGELPDNQAGLMLITFEDALKELRSRPINLEEAVACLRWWTTSGAKLSEKDRVTTQKALMDAVIILLPTEGGNAERIVPLSIIKTFLDPKRLPLDGPLPDHVLPHSISRNFTSAVLIASFHWSELSLLQWVQHICDPKTRTTADYDLEVSAVWAEQVLATLARNWSMVSGEMKGKIVVTMRQLRCIPTNSGLRIPGEVYFPGANIFPDLPVITLPSGVAVKGPLEKAVEGLGVRRDVELQTLFNKMIKTNEWTISDLLKHLATRSLQPEELSRLQMTQAFPKEDRSNTAVTGKPPRYMAKELYEPSDVFRQLGLPVLDWGGKHKWRSASPEAKLAFTLGLQRQPPIDVLVNLCANPDLNVQQTAWQYLVDNVATKYQDFDPTKFQQIAFIPSVRDGTRCLGAPADVFSNPEWSAFGFLVTHPSITKDSCTKLHINLDPSPDKMVSFLTNHQPSDEARAKVWFEIMSSHMREYGPSHFSTLSKATIVPSKSESVKALQWLAPSQCYFRRTSTTGSYSKLFTFVDFGPSANSFLAACGTRQEPSPDEVARRLLQNPQQFYDTVDGATNYMTELQRIAVGQQQLTYDTRQRMKQAQFLLASRRTPRKKFEKEKGDNLDDDEWDTEFSLRTPGEVVIADDLNAYQLFGEKLFVAPQEDILEAFYITLGSRRLSSLVMERCKFTTEVPNSKTAIETRHLVLERLPLFLHEHTHAKTKISFNWLNSKDHFVVKTFGKLTVTKSLTVGQTHLEHALEASAFSPPFDGHSVKLYLAGNSQLDMYEIAMSLVRQLFASPKANDALLLMTILSTDLRALKRRGYNVERILKQQQAERQAAEQARAKAVEQAPNVPEKAGNMIPEPEPSMPGDIFRPSASAVKNTFHNSFQNFKQKLGQPGGLLSTGHDSSQTQPRIEDTPPVPPVPSQTRPGGTKVGEASKRDISSNIDMAISACRPEKNHLLHNRNEMRIIKESLNEGYCDLSGHAGSLKKVATMHNVHVYLPHTTQIPEIDAFLSSKRDPIARFVHVMTTLSKIYSLPMENMHIFNEDEGTVIAFNRNGSIFLNLRYYLQWHDDDVRSGNFNSALVSWYFTLAHEIAHNLVQPHNSEHEFYLSAICEKHLMDLGNVLYNV
ncbi:hypothetical protein BDZ89DRAFT_1098552 [Hymenopellis radicata]|nr:hypothetical protein BDZ89DRAFT_1098552 [Hymenopellis radicata]